MPRIIKIPSDSGGSSNSTYQTPITATSTTFDGTQEGSDKIYVFEKETVQDLTLAPDVYVVNDEIHLENRGNELMKIQPTADVRIRGDFDIDGNFLIPRNSLGFLKCRGVVDGNEEFTIAGTVGGSGSAVAGTVYSPESISVAGTHTFTVTGTGFTEDMIVTLTGNATLNSWAYIDRNTITLNITHTGVVDDTFSIKYDNNLITTDTDVITAVTEALLYTTNPFPYGWGAVKLSDLVTYCQRWRRSSDDAETDVGYDAGGKIGLTSLVSAGGTLASWLGTDNAFLVTEYNQGDAGATWDNTQTVANEQPQVATSGALLEAGSLAWGSEYDGSNDSLATTLTRAWVDGNYSIFCNVRFMTTDNQQIISAGSGDHFWLRYRSATSTIQFLTSDGGSQISTDSGVKAADTNYRIAVTKGDTNIKLYVDDSLESTLASPATDITTSKAMYFGKNETGTHPLEGYRNYVVFYTDDQDANASSIDSILAAAIS